MAHNPNWSKRIGTQQAFNRAGGRNRINAEKQNKAIENMNRAVKMFYAGYSRKEIQEKLNISRTTLWRYLGITRGKFYLKCSHGYQEQYKNGQLRYSVFRRYFK